MHDAKTFPGEVDKKFDQYGLQDFLSTNTDVVYLGDVFMKGYEPPDFVGTVRQALELWACLASPAKTPPV